ncbi:MAG: hypothetical protein WCG23_00125 [bacterium]
MKTILHASTLKVLKILENKADTGNKIVNLSQNTIKRYTGLDRFTIRACIQELEDYKVLTVNKIWGICNTYRLENNYKELLQELLQEKE